MKKISGIVSKILRGSILEPTTIAAFIPKLVGKYIFDLTLMKN